MPTYEYRCDVCCIDFEELLIRQDEIKQYSDSHPCPNCKSPAERNRVSMFGFSFKGNVRGTSGVHGNSGVHDWDYPTLDKAVARSSEAKWTKNAEKIESLKAAKQMSEVNGATLSADGKFEAMTKSDVDRRGDLIKILKDS